ncbi:MAG TPA: GAF domain-containing protein, partial [Burkholderiales bacterium]|nr:GAF domain-containing protein [Burkholderiales bacterium]
MARATKSLGPTEVTRLRKALDREKAKSAALTKSRAEALEQQAAAAEILKVISRSPADPQPVFDAIVQRAMRLLRGHSAMVSRVIDDKLHLAAITSTSKAGDAALRKTYPRPITKESSHARVVHSRKTYMIRDTETTARVQTREIARQRGYRSMVVVPMLRGGAAIGAISVTRKEPGLFSRREV